MNLDKILEFDQYIPIDNVNRVKKISIKNNNNIYLPTTLEF